MSKEKADKEIERYITVERDGETFAIDNPEYVKKIQNEKYEYFLNKSGIPIFYHSIEFNDYHGQKHSEEFRKIKYYAEHCHEEKFRYVSLYLWGNQGCQKTALMCNIGKQAIKNGLKVKFILAGELIAKLIKISGYSQDEEIEREIKELKEQDMLLIDDCLDIQKNLTWNNSKHLITAEWDNFLRHALSQGQRIIFTSNNSLESAKDIFGESLYELLDRNVEKFRLSDSVKQKRKLNVSSVFEGV